MKHYYFNIVPKLKEVLKTDNYNEFIKLYNTEEDIINNFYVGFQRCEHNNKKECQKDCIALVILKKNLSSKTYKISEHAIKKYKVNLECMMILINKLKKSENKSQHIKKLIITGLMYSKMSSDDFEIILEKIFGYDQDIVDLLHGFSYRIRDINSIVNKISQNKINKLLEMKYKFNPKSIIYLIGKYNIYDPSILAKLGFSQKLITDPKNHNCIIDLISKNNIKLLKFIRKNDFEFTNDFIEKIIKSRNFEIISYLINKKITLTTENIKKLFFIKEKPKKSNKKNQRFRFWIARRINIEIGRKIKKIENYEEHMINILNKVNVSNKILNGIFEKALQWLLYGYCFKLISFIVKKLDYDIKHHMCNEYIDNLMSIIIKNDDIDNLKKIFEYKIFLPIDISRETRYMNDTLIRNSSKLIDYFSNDLKMVCSNLIHTDINSYSIKNKKQFVNNLIKIGYPINDNVIKNILKGGNFDIISDLIDKGYKMPSIVIDYAIINKKYTVANKLFEKGITIIKKGYIDKIIKFALMRNTFNWWSYNHLQNFPINSNKQLDYMVKLGCTTSDKSHIIELVASQGGFDIIPYMYEKFGYIPSFKAILNFFEGNIRRCDQICTNKLINFFEYYKNVMNKNIFTSEYFKHYNFKNICRIIGDDISKRMLLFKYVVKESGTVLTHDHLKYVIGYMFDPLFSEVFEFFKEHNVIPDKEFLLTFIRDGNSSLTQYLVKTYNFKFTLKEIHNLITSKMANIDIIFTLADELNITITPYTIELWFETYFLDGWYRRSDLYSLLTRTKKITHKTHEMIENVQSKTLNKIIKKNKISVVNYDPSINDEIPEIQPLQENHHLEFINDELQEPKEKDYVDEILDEYKL
ncbi:hypothetical protein Indivirus_1_109 [Indivirus ILV1]|uniref:Uncharacterized protein n=1 Tax=Indivirus ILV1 TaxID=1977633 RepID=A0A1V0SCP7_9VIRU|nr:hypothetical protein Indivirus_1_109 [Indivirus ILV1]